jgi:hypothetical protein
MAENIPTPGGALPPKKETGKVQPKKETVRINLPPKPSAAPTIKLPTLPPGGPTGAPTAAAPAAPTAAAPAPRAQAAPIAQRPPPSPVSRAPVQSGPAFSKVDSILAICAAVVGLVAVASVVLIMLMNTE